MGLIETIGKDRAALDASVFIYFIEEDPAFEPVLDPLFEEADSGRRELVTSEITLLEVLVVPYREGNRVVAQRYENLLTRGRGLKMVEIDRPLLRWAAMLRARHAARTPDAIQLAAAITTDCRVFVTNDRRLPAIPSLRVLQLRDFV